MEKIEVNGKTYVLESSVKSLPNAKSVKGMNYCIVRTYSAGVFAGYIKDKQGKENTVYQARRLWYWDGAASLSQISQDGVSKPSTCKFPAEVPEVCLKEIIEIIPCTEKARMNISEVPLWKK